MDMNELGMFMDIVESIDGNSAKVSTPLLFVSECAGCGEDLDEVVITTSPNTICNTCIKQVAV